MISFKCLIKFMYLFYCNPSVFHKNVILKKMCLERDIVKIASHLLKKCSLNTNTFYIFNYIQLQVIKKMLKRYQTLDKYLFIKFYVFISTVHIIKSKR